MRQETNRDKTTLTQKFRTELQSLITLLESSERHYVRCIKPNESKKPQDFVPKKVLAQLRSNGVMETVRLRKAGYPQKMDSERFYSRYQILGIKSPQAVKSFLDEFAPPDTWALGNTKIFLRQALVQKKS